MIKTVFMIFFSDPVVLSVLVGAMIIIGVLIIVTDILWGRW